MTASGSDGNGGLVGLGGKLVEGMRGSPALLSIIVLNVILMAGVFWSVKEERQLEYQVTTADKELVSDITKLLAECQERNGRRG